MLCFFYKAKPRTSDYSRPSAFAFVYLWISSLEAQSVLYRSNRKISAVFSSPSWAPLVQCERSNKLYSAWLAIRQFVKKSWRGEGVKTEGVHFSEIKIHERRCIRGFLFENVRCLCICYSVDSNCKDWIVRSSLWWHFLILLLGQRIIFFSMMLLQQIQLHCIIFLNGIGPCKDRVTSRSEFRRKCTCKIPSLNVVNNDEKANLWQR